MSFTATFPVGLTVEWMPPEDANIPNVTLKDWLLDTGSLTDRVQSLCNSFSLRLLGQEVLTPHKNELSLLQGNKETHYQATSYQVREILLCDNDSPWVFARSVIPQAIIDAELSNLGREPLGKRLFNDKRFLRSEFQVCKLSSAQATQLGGDTSHSLWGRRSVFTFEAHHLIVAEVFLPPSPVYASNGVYL